MTQFEFDIFAIEHLGKLTLQKCFVSMQPEHPLYDSLAPAMELALNDQDGSSIPEVVLPMQSLTATQLEQAIEGFKLLQRAFIRLALPIAAQFCAELIQVTEEEKSDRLYPGRRRKEKLYGPSR
jgi:hypothetical protein